MDYLLGLILMKKKDFVGAAAHWRTYVTLVPNSPEVAEVQAQIADAERLSRASLGQDTQAR